MMKHLSWTLPLLLAAVVFAHDEGHGPVLTDQPKMGGVVTAVVDAKDAPKGPEAPLVYKAELVRSEDGKARVYLYDKDMNALDLAKFDKKAKGVVETIKKKKVSKAAFELTLQDGAFVGTPPKPARKPFNIDVTLQEGERKLLAAFDNLD
jgi:hypothetical protein